MFIPYFADLLRMHFRKGRFINATNYVSTVLFFPDLMNMVQAAIFLLPLIKLNLTKYPVQWHSGYFLSLHRRLSIWQANTIFLVITVNSASLKICHFNYLVFFTCMYISSATFLLKILYWNLVTENLKHIIRVTIGSIIEKNI